MSGEKRMKAHVGRDGRIEVMVPDLPAGQAVEVTVRSLQEPAPRRSVLDILHDAPGGLMFKSADEVDAYIRGERDSWGD